MIPLSERFNDSEQDIRYKSRIDINKALNPSERSSFYQSLMPNNQREYYRVADNAIIVPDNSNDQNFKLVIYSGDHVDYEITGVYKISNYEYNIHDKVPNAFDALSKMERDEIDESDARAILGNCELLFGSVFKKYNPQTGRYTKFTRSSIKSTSSYQKESSRTGVSDRAGQTGIKYLSDRDENPFQDFEISDWEYDDTTADTIAREYVSHHEDIGEVFKNRITTGARNKACALNNGGKNSYRLLTIPPFFGITMVDKR